MKYALREIPEEWHQFCRLHAFNCQSRVSPRHAGSDEQLDAILIAFGRGTKLDDDVADRIGRNRARKHRLRDRLVQDRLVQERLFRFDEVASLPDDVVEKAAIADHVAWVRSNTSAKEWHSLWLLAEGFSYAQVAQTLHLSEGTLKSQVARCRARLRMLPRAT